MWCLLFYGLSCYLIEHLRLYNVEVRKWEHTSIPLSWNKKNILCDICDIRPHAFI